MLITNTLLCVLILVLIWSTVFITDCLKDNYRMIHDCKRQMINCYHILVNFESARIFKTDLNTHFGYTDTDSVKED